LNFKAAFEYCGIKDVKTSSDVEKIEES